jgi:hypothetical protein
VTDSDLDSIRHTPWFGAILENMSPS